MLSHPVLAEFETLDLEKPRARGPIANDIQSVKAKIEELGNEIRKLSAKLVEPEKKLSDIKTDLAAKTREIASIETAIPAMQKQIEEYTNDIFILTEAVARDKKKLSAPVVTTISPLKIPGVKELNNFSKRLVGQPRKIHDSKDVFITRSSDVAKDIKTNSGLLKSCQDETEKLFTTIREKEARLNKLRLEIKALETQKTEKETALTPYRDSLESLRVQLEGQTVLLDTMSIFRLFEHLDSFHLKPSIKLTEEYQATLDILKADASLTLDTMTPLDEAKNPTKTLQAYLKVVALLTQVQKALKSENIKNTIKLITDEISRKLKITGLTRDMAGIKLFDIDMDINKKLTLPLTAMQQTLTEWFNKITPEFEKPLNVQPLVDKKSALQEKLTKLKAGYLKLIEKGLCGSINKFAAQKKQIVDELLALQEKVGEIAQDIDVLISYVNTNGSAEARAHLKLTEHRESAQALITSFRKTLPTFISIEITPDEFAAAIKNSPPKNSDQDMACEGIAEAHKALLMQYRKYKSENVSFFEKLFAKRMQRRLSYANELITKLDEFKTDKLHDQTRLKTYLATGLKEYQPSFFAKHFGGDKKDVSKSLHLILENLDRQLKDVTSLATHHATTFSKASSPSAVPGVTVSSRLAPD